MSKENMDHSGRLFNCARCRTQVIICSDCDRNNIYCGKQCAKIARYQSLQAAGQRYQQSRHGQLKHADRQRRYRERQIEKVTHHSSSVLPSNDLLSPGQNRQVACSMQPIIHGLCCHFCKRLGIEFLRTGFLRHPCRPSPWSFAP